MIIRNDDDIRVIVVQACIEFAKAGGKYSGLSARTAKYTIDGKPIMRQTIAKIIDGDTMLPRLRTAIVIALALGITIEARMPNQGYVPEVKNRNVEVFRPNRRKLR